MSGSIDIPVVSKFDPTGIRKAEGALKGFKSSVGKLGGIVAAAFSARAITNFVKTSVNAASDLSESLNAVSVAYGGASESIIKLGEDAAQRLGVTQADFNAAAVRFSAFAERVVGAGGNVTGFVDDITTRAADFASVFNIDVSEALQVFQSGLSGEAEPLKRFGINLLDSEVKAYALRTGLIGVGDTMTEQEKVQARYGLLMESTAKTAGDFANTSDGLANSQRILEATFTDMQATIGEALLPAFAEIVQSLVPILDEIMPTLEQAFKDLTPAITAIGSAIPPLLSAIAPLVPLFAQIVTLLAEQLVQVMPLVVGLFEAFVPIIDQVLQAVMPIVEQAFPILVQLLEMLTAMFMPIIDAILPIVIILFETLAPVVLQLIEAFMPLLEMILPVLTELIENLVVPALLLAAGILEDVLPRAVGWLTGTLEGFLPFLQGFVSTFSVIFNVLTDVVFAIVNGIVAAIEGFANFFIDATNKIIQGVNKLRTEVGKKPIDLIARVKLQPLEAPGKYDNLIFPTKDTTGISDLVTRQQALAGQRAQSLAGGMRIDTSTLAGLRELTTTRGFYTDAQGNTIFGNVTPFARGGIVTGPTLSLIGEAGPEAVIPLNKSGKFGATYNITVNAGVGDPAAIGQQVVNAITRYERMSGPVFARA